MDQPTLDAFDRSRGRRIVAANEGKREVKIARLGGWEIAQREGFWLSVSLIWDGGREEEEDE